VGTLGQWETRGTRCLHRKAAAFGEWHEPCDWRQSSTSAFRRFLAFGPAARFCCILPAGGRSKGSCRQIDIVEALGIDPADTAPKHWRHVHNRLFVNETRRSYRQNASPGLAPAQKDETVSHCLITLLTTASATTVLLLMDERNRAPRHLPRGVTPPGAPS
jgi:hypothetical protein